MIGTVFASLLPACVFGSEARIGVVGALERLDAPVGAPLWRDISLEGSLREGVWQVDGAARTVRRWSRNDGEIRFGVRREWFDSWTFGCDGSAGLRGTFLPSWTVRGSVETKASGGWVFGADWKFADYSGFGVHEPGLRSDRYWGPWRLGMVVAFPWTDGLFPGVSGRVSTGWDWSDAGGISAALGSSRELEAAASGVADRRALTISGGARQSVGSRTTLRAWATWTSLESVHDRLEGRLGVEFRLGG